MKKAHLPALTDNPAAFVKGMVMQSDSGYDLGTTKVFFHRTFEAIVVIPASEWPVAQMFVELDHDWMEVVIPFDK